MGKSSAKSLNFDFLMKKAALNPEPLFVFRLVFSVRQDEIFIVDGNAVFQRIQRGSFHDFCVTIHPERIDGIIAMSGPCSTAIGGGVGELFIRPQAVIVSLKIQDFDRRTLHRPLLDRLLVCGRGRSGDPVAGRPLEAAITALRLVNRTAAAPQFMFGNGVDTDWNTVFRRRFRAKRNGGGDQFPVGPFPPGKKR